jgi:hypothetical protein
MGAVTTGKWNHREEPIDALFHRRIQSETACLEKTTLRVKVHAQIVGLNAETKKGSALSRRGNFLDIPFYRTSAITLLIKT